ncbi:amino acid ABC transporter permease [Acuticoccus kandeliae]|uniref:amino acid ABC transporter permease n=1 Tax=Acuticoccus kandeliae TaxID=2073160 RepID=UPI000D3E18FA|nr:amino acid ABC transporter permease [Acuticoccus kandeliae]
MDLIIQTLPLLWRGLVATFQLALLTLALVAVISVLFGIMSVSRHVVVRWIAIVYVEFFRGIPLIVNLLFTYFGAPLIGLSLDPFTSATVSLTTWGAANGAEIVRGGFAAIPRHQGESAAALALRPWETMWFILLPQIILPVLPSFTGLFSILIQATSLASLVGAMEFLRTAQIIVERSTLMTGHSPAFIVFGFVLIVYFVICFSLNLFTAWLERVIGSRRERRVSAHFQTVDPA